MLLVLDVHACGWLAGCIWINSIFANNFLTPMLTHTAGWLVAAQSPAVVCAREQATEEQNELVVRFTSARMQK